jgi:hypothetical protein
MPNDLTVIGSNFSQAHQRRYLRLLDQHGRRWGVNIEIRNGAPTGPWDTFFWVPSRKLIPSAKYLKLNAERPNRVWIDYDAIIRDIRQEQKEYDTEIDRQMRKRYREGYNREKIDVDVLNAVGVRPGPVEIWVACKQGNRYALGLSTVVDERVQKFLPQVMEDQAIAELDFSDGGSPVDPALAVEMADARKVADAWDMGSENAAPVEDPELDELFDPDFMGGGKTVNPKAAKTQASTGGKRRGRPPKVKPDAKAALLETE